MKPIYILTNFSTYLRSYSPIIVVSEQLLMFQRNGYNPILIASEGWDPPEDSIFSKVETRRITPAHVYNDPKEFNDVDLKEIDELEKQFLEIFDQDAIVITHDLIFLPDYVKHNVAARRVVEKRSDISWVHWIHSATSPNSLIRERAMYGEKYAELLSDKFPNSIVAFPNSESIPRVARNFNYEEDEIFEVPHSTNPVEGMAPIVQRLYDEKELGEQDVIMVYPLRLDRGKNAEWNVRVIAALNRMGIRSHLIFCDFQSTGDDKVVYREDLKALALELNHPNSVTFLSEFDQSAVMESDHKVVLDLFTLSNVFLMPSKSETYSLVAQEAMLKGNFCILNYDFTPFRQIYGQNAIYRQFSSNVGFDGMDGEITTEYGEGPDAYADVIARNISYYLEHDKVVRAKTWVRRDRNPDAVFRNYLEPLIYRDHNDA